MDGGGGGGGGGGPGSTDSDDKKRIREMKLRKVYRWYPWLEKYRFFVLDWLLLCIFVIEYTRQGTKEGNKWK